VALPTLSDSSGRNGPLLGLPQIVDQLRHLPELPRFGRGRRRLLRARSHPGAAPRRWDSGLLGGRCHPTGPGDLRSGRWLAARHRSDRSPAFAAAEPARSLAGPCRNLLEKRQAMGRGRRL